MSRLSLSSPKLRWLRLRHQAQNLVEFGVIVAAVSLFGLAGLNLLGRAELGYFIPLSNALAPLAPTGTGDVVHPTQVTIDCVPTTVIVGNATTCTFTVKDAWTSKRTWPQGTVHLLVNTVDSGVCTLVQDTSSGDPALSKCSLSWSPTISNVPSATLAAHYVPTDGAHAPPSPDPSQVLTVKQLPTITFTPTAGHTTGCWDANNVFTSPEQVEMGHPIICHLSVADSSGPIASTPIQVTGSLSDSGTPHFSCFTNNNRSAYASCNPEGPAFSGTTDATGQLTFVYRRYYASLTSNVTETFTASATAYPGASGSHAVTIVPPSVLHFTDMAIHCASNVPAGAQATWTARSGLTLESDVRLNGTSGTLVTCTIVVLDTDPMNAYTSGNIDNEDAFPPYGTVNWFDELNNPIPNESGQPAKCITLSMGNPLGSPYVPLQQRGLPEYASSCTVTLRLIGNHRLTAEYMGESAPQWHSTVLSNTIDSNFP